MDQYSVDPSVLESTGYAPAYPSPSPAPQDEGTPQPEHSSRKKRKAWGQPVPEIKHILPPRKRAKTAEEKEQRKNERILRNRRAADKSRQRQKAAVADLEVRQRSVEQENRALRQILERYQAQFGVLADVQFPTPAMSYTSLDSLPTPSPYDLENVQQPSTPVATMIDDTNVSNEISHTPQLSPDSVPAPVNHDSPTLGPLLFNHQSEEQQVNDVQTSFDSSNVSGLTQYPAAVLCDLQCQPEYSIKLRWTDSNSFSNNLKQVLSTMQFLMVFQSYSNSMLTPIFKLFRILEKALSRTSADQDLSFIQDHFQVIHSLISLPMTETRPAVFRMKLLSRLLACSPLMARHLLAATDRALQQVVSEEGFAEDKDRRWTWSSLMTIKWVILRLEREHRKIRWHVASDRGWPAKDHVMNGVDWRAVQRSSGLWMGSPAYKSSGMVLNHVVNTAPEVH